jgi:hypothetical protein
MTHAIFRTATGLIFTVLLTSSAAAQSENSFACRPPPPSPCTGCSPEVAEKIRQRDIKRLKEMEQNCLEKKRKEAKQIEERPEGNCTGPLSNPRVRAYGGEVLTAMRKDRTWASPAINLQGTLQDFVRLIQGQIYEHYGAAVQQHYYDALGKADLGTLQACFPGLEVLLAEKRQKIQDEENARVIAAAEARKPVNRLLAGYKRYALVKFCNEVRQGYLMVYVNDIELARARTAVKVIEDDAVREDSNLDTDAIWRRANAEMKGRYAEQYQCQRGLNELLQQSAAIHPENSIIQKDF